MNKKTTPHGLGRGLSALLGEIDEPDVTAAPMAEKSADSAVEVSLSDIDVNRSQPRQDFDEESLKELAQSIESVGVIQPIVLRKNGERYSIIVGERRFRASLLAGKTTIPAIIRDIDDDMRR